LGVIGGLGGGGGRKESTPHRFQFFGTEAPWSKHKNHGLGNNLEKKVCQHEKKPCRRGKVDSLEKRKGRTNDPTKRGTRKAFFSPKRWGVQGVAETVSVHLPDLKYVRAANMVWFSMNMAR